MHRIIQMIRIYLNHLLHIASLVMDVGPGLSRVQSQDAACRLVLLMTRGADERDEFAVLIKLRVFIIQHILQVPFDVVQEHYRSAVLWTLQIVVCEIIFEEPANELFGLVQGEPNTEVEETSRCGCIWQEVLHEGSLPVFAIIGLESIYNKRGQLGEEYWLEHSAVIVQYLEPTRCVRGQI